MNIDTVVGKRVLQILDGSDAQYASEPQFRIFKEGTKWVIEHAPAAKNPTYVNGKPLDGKRAHLTDDSVVSIGPARLRLQVKLEFDA